jgi:hypothetical protein
MGGLAGLRHFLLRALLARTNLFPWRSIRFLDDAARRILLYKDGGGYRFIHRLLLDYFASLEVWPPATQQGTRYSGAAYEQGNVLKSTEALRPPSDKVQP